MGLGGEVLQEQRIRRAFEADTKLEDFAFGQGTNCTPAKRRCLNNVATLPSRDRRGPKPPRAQCRTCHAGRPATVIGHPAGE
jgi:hypothetical protein